MKLADDDEGAVSQVLTDYYRAFSTLDAQVIKPYFHEPSQLVSPAGVVATPTRAAVAAVFQPVMEALRVFSTLAARAAQLVYRPFSPADVTPDLCQDSAIVTAKPWKGHDVTAIVLLPVGASDPAQAIQPRWTRPFEVAAPAFFGALWLALPHVTLIQAFPGGVDLQHGLVAAFDPSALEAEREVVIVYDGRFLSNTSFGRTNEYRVPVQPDWR